MGGGLSFDASSEVYIGGRTWPLRLDGGGGARRTVVVVGK